MLINVLELYIQYIYKLTRNNTYTHMYIHRKHSEQNKYVCMYLFKAAHAHRFLKLTMRCLND